MQERIRWNQNELALVASRWVDLCEHKFLNPLTTSQVFSITKEAQTVLAKNRRRPDSSIASRSSIPTLVTAIGKEHARRLKLAKELAENNKAKAKVEAETTHHHHEPHPKATHHENSEHKHTGVNAKEKTHEPPVAPVTVTPANKTVEVPAAHAGHTDHASHTGHHDPIQSLASMPGLDELAAQMGKRVAAVMLREIQTAFNNHFTTQLPKMQQQAASLTGKLPKVIVIGPLPKQQPFLESAVDGMLDLKFVSSEENASLISLRGKDCLMCLLWSNYVSHSHQDVAKQVFKGDRFRVEKGGIETLKEKLEEMAIVLA